MLVTDGIRNGDIRNIMASDVDLAHNRIKLAFSKSGRRGEINIHSQVKEDLQNVIHMGKRPAGIDELHGTHDQHIKLRMVCSIGHAP